MADQNTARPRKIAIMGMGNPPGGIGKELWKELTEAGTADQIVVYNRSNKWDNENFKGEMIAVDQANLINNRHKDTSQFKFTTDPREAMANADIVVIAGGAKRPKDRPMSRADLMQLNCDFIDPLAAAAKDVNTNATFILATNPVDTMAQRFHEKSGIGADRIMGLSGELDRARMIQSISNQLQIPPNYIENANVIGQHGEGMVPVLSQVMIRYPDQQPRKLVEILANEPEKLEEIKKATIEGGGRLVKRLDIGSDYIAPAAGLKRMVDEVIAAKQGKKTEPLFASAMNEKEGIYIGQPVQINSDGKHTVLPLPELNRGETEAWSNSVKLSNAMLGDLPGRKVDRPFGG
jgi:malate dehydrogenase